jgi:hypothetical protein
MNDPNLLAVPIISIGSVLPVNALIALTVLSNAVPILATKSTPALAALYLTSLSCPVGLPLASRIGIFNVVAFNPPASPANAENLSANIPTTKAAF